MKLPTRIWSIGTLLVVCLAGSACGANQNGDASDPLAPSPMPTADSFMIDIAEINGPYSFYPSPATITAGQTVYWRNSDVVTHRVVFDDGSIDTGPLAAGTVSQPQAVGPGNWTYHCAIHPEMVGSVSVRPPAEGEAARASAAATASR